MNTLLVGLLLNRTDFSVSVLVLRPSHFPLPTAAAASDTHAVHLLPHVQAVYHEADGGSEQCFEIEIV